MTNEKAKPDVNDVEKLIELKKLAEEVYKEIDELNLVLLEEFGEGTYYYELTNGDKPFLKFSLVDNVKELAKGNNVWKSMVVKPVSSAITFLKRRPTSLK